jgi:hypothetical protein
LNLVEDGNLFWSPVNGDKMAANYFDVFRQTAEFTKSKELHPDGSSSHSLVADPKFVHVETDFTKANDYSLKDGSPAIGKGFVLPAEWPDPFRPSNGRRPDIGAIPVGEETFKAGRSGKMDGGPPSSEIPKLKE